MKKFSKVIMIFLVWLLFEILKNSHLVIQVVLDSVTLFKNNVFPSLFPFFVISDLLIGCGFVEWITPWLNKILTPLFKMNGTGNFIFLMSILSGCPSNAKIAKALLDDKKITKKEVEHVLSFSHFSNPLFILGTVAVCFLKNKKAAILVLISHYVGNIIIGLITRKKIVFTDSKLPVTTGKRLPIGTIFNHAVTRAIQALLLILGTLTTFMLISTIIIEKIPLFEPIPTILKGLLEMTQGLQAINHLKISLKLKSMLSVMFLSFGGFSVHMQVVSILSDDDIAYLPYLKARVCHALISTLVLFLSYDFFNI